jgi:hypothetical protein
MGHRTHGRRTIARPALERDVAPDRPQSCAIDFWESLRERAAVRRGSGSPPVLAAPSQLAASY